MGLFFMKIKPRSDLNAVFYFILVSELFRPYGTCNLHVKCTTIFCPYGTAGGFKFDAKRFVIA